MTQDVPPGNNLFVEGQLVASLKAKGLKVSKAAIQLDKELPLLTRDELEKVYNRLTLDALSDPETTPAERRELLSKLDVCPCCQRWLGHNRPPEDDEPPHRRQPSFDF
jgi:hypothetical protein